MNTNKEIESMTQIREHTFTFLTLYGKASVVKSLVLSKNTCFLWSLHFSKTIEDFNIDFKGMLIQLVV